MMDYVPFFSKNVYTYHFSKKRYNIEKHSSIVRVATSFSFRGGAIFMKFHLMTSSCLFNRGTTFSQMVTYNNMYFCSQTRCPQYKHTHSAQRWLIKTDKTERFATALEAESPVSSEISDFTPYAHALSNILHIKYAE